MEKIAPEIYDRIDNDLYNAQDDLRWNPENVRT